MRERNGRIVWIDQLRGVAIFLVILGHVSLPAKINGLIYTFHMPLFFVITGLTIKNQKLLQCSIKEYIIVQAERLLIPYFWMNFMMYPLWYFTFHHLGATSLTVPQALLGIFLGNSSLCGSPSNALWFLLVLMLAKILYLLFLKASGGNPKKLFVWILFSAILGLVEQGKDRIWHFNVAFTAVVFVYLGSCIMKWYQEGGKGILQETGMGKIVMVLVFLLIIGTTAAYLNGRVSMNRNLFGNSICLFYIAAIAFCAFFILCAMNLIPERGSSKALITYIGRNTLLYVGFHLPILRMLEHLFSGMQMQYWYSVVEAIILYFGMKYLCMFVNHFFPYVAGKESMMQKGNGIISKTFLMVWCIGVPYMYVVWQCRIYIGEPSALFGGIMGLCIISITLVQCARHFFPIVFLEKQSMGTMR